MKLKVIKYKNYGCTMTGPADKESEWENKFYWSFHELNKCVFFCKFKNGVN